MPDLGRGWWSGRAVMVRDSSYQSALCQVRRRQPADDSPPREGDLNSMDPGVLTAGLMLR